MENIKFISRISLEVPRKANNVGNCIYYVLNNGNRVKAYCVEDGVILEVINTKEGKIDNIKLPFANYFEPVQCSENSPYWYQHIEKGKWHFEESYIHVLPKVSDYRSIAKAIEDYICMFE